MNYYLMIYHNYKVFPIFDWNRIFYKSLFFYLYLLLLVLYFDSNDNYTLNDIAYLICRGGWPISVQDDKELGYEITRNYYDSFFVFENSENEKFRNKKPEILKMIFRSLARNISIEAPNTTIIYDKKGDNQMVYLHIIS